MNEMNHELPGNRRVLVIDDNRAIHDDFRKLLCPDTSAGLAMESAEAELFGNPPPTNRQAQFQLESAYQGEDGVRLVEQALNAGRPYAMAFVDVRMPPGMNGVETTQRIWALDPEIQIVLCTAYSDASWDEMLATIGDSDRMLILKKPFDAIEAIQLARALTEKWCLGRQARRQTEDLERIVAVRTSELQETVQKLESARNMLQLIIETIPIRVFWKDQDLRFLGCNTLFAHDAGLSNPLEILGKDDFAMAWKEQAERYQTDDRQVMATGCPKLNIVEEHTTPAGSTIWVNTSKAPMRKPDGEIFGVLGVYEDITQRKQLEAQLFQSQKLETVGKLAGGVAHEFNSILTAIIGQSEMLAADLPPTDRLRDNTTAITQAANRAATLTRQLLAYGRKQMLRPQILDLNAVLSGMRGMIRHLAGNNSTLRMDLAAGLHSVKADPGQLEQVIINLVMNAAQAMPHGGKLTIQTSHISLDENYVRQFPDVQPGDYVRLAITDTGAGMTKSVKARLFEPFFTTKGVGKGTGLGLATCYGILKQSGGHINVYSEPGRGSTFSIYLPQVPHSTKTICEPVEAPNLAGGIETILLVEDDSALRQMAATLLGRLGYTIVTASNGVEAMSLMQEPGRGHIDLLFTDLVMPHMSGKELADRIRLLHPQTRILFTSAYTESALVHEGVLEEGVALLQKPFTPGALARIVREMLDQRSVTAPPEPGPD
jgi:two-component system, cell cycle sensor histidine kinase and response regulator CckA